MDRVASRARTGKAALYRRWPSRAELVVEACAERDPADAGPPDTGTLRGDALALMRWMVRKFTSPTGGILRGLLAEMDRDPEFAQVVRERIGTAGAAWVRPMLRRAAERGEIEPWVVDSRRATVATDLLRHQYLLFGPPIDDAFLETLVDEVYLPLLHAPAD